MRVTTHTAHTVPDRPPIQVDVGQEVDIGARADDWPEFVFVSSDLGSGWVPARHLTISGHRGIVHTPYDTAELATQVGEILDVIAEDRQSGWLWCRGRNGAEGWVPIRTIDEAEPEGLPEPLPLPAGAELPSTVLARLRRDER